MQSWNLYDAESGDELTAGYQATDEQAAKMAQRRANELGRAVELCEYGSAEDGEIFEPGPNPYERDAMLEARNRLESVVKLATTFPEDP